MHAQGYDPLSQEGDHDLTEPYNSDARSSDSHIRPAVYYGEGPFDPPSSDDEEGHLLEAKDPPGLVGTGGEDPIESDFIGGSQKVGKQ